MFATLEGLFLFLKGLFEKRTALRASLSISISKTPKGLSIV
jgi:hypothetical protein